MPHITMLYPFAPREMFDRELLRRLAGACRGTEPFDVALERFRHFRHGRASFTIWLDPQPVDAIDALQQLLLGQFPDYGDVRAHANEFRPHLSVGQAKGDDRCAQIQQELQDEWSPMTFTADRVALIYEGRFLITGTPAELRSCEDSRVQDFLHRRPRATQDGAEKFRRFIDELDI